MKKIIKRIHKKNKGFSLLEVLLAVVLLAIVVTPLIQTIYSSMALNNKARIQMGATDVAQSLVEGFEAMTYSDIKDLLEDNGNNVSITSINYVGKSENNNYSYPGKGNSIDFVHVSKQGWADQSGTWANNRISSSMPDKYIAYSDSDFYGNDSSDPEKSMDFYTINRVSHNGYDYDMVVYITPLLFIPGDEYKVYEVQVDVYYDDPKDSVGLHNKENHLLASYKGSVFNKLD